MRRTTKRLVPLAAGLAAGSLVIAGCSSGGGNTASPGTHGTVTVLYRTASLGSTRVFQVVQQELGQVGIQVKGLGSSNADFYTKYLQRPDVAKKGTWDIAIGGWVPDWYGNGAASFFLPLFSGPASFPPVGSNYGFYNNPAATKLIDQAVTTADNATALKLWGQADRQVMKDAAFFPITDPQQANYASKNIGNRVFMSAFQNYDPTNVTKTGAQAKTLTMLGSGDVDYMDPNLSYYTIGYLALRMWSRQLFTYPAIAGRTTLPSPDLATALPTLANGGISKDGRTVTVHLRPGAMWNTKPARPVTAEDVVRGVKRTCNPVQPFGGVPDFADLIQGYQAFCKAFKAQAGTTPSVASIKKAIDAPLPGVTAANPGTVVFKLTHPSTYFVSMLTLPAFSPAPVESLDYLPASAPAAQHTVSDGPYEIATYQPTKQIVFSRNPAWKQSSDPIRKQNFDKIVVNETVSQDSTQQQLETGTPTADMEWDNYPPATVIPGLQAKKDPNLTVGPTSSLNPFLIYNIASPNNDGAMGRIAFRQAISYALDRDALIKVIGGPLLNHTHSHVLPAEIDGSVPFDLYPYDPAQAQSLLANLGK